MIEHFSFWAIIIAFGGCVLGYSYALKVYDNQAMLTTLKKSLQNLISLLLIVLCAYILISNLPLFLEPQAVSSFSELITIMLQNKANIQLIQLFAFTLFACFLIFIQRTFSGEWEHIKIGEFFEGKKVVKAQQDGIHTLAKYRAYEHTKQTYLKLLSSHDLYLTIYIHFVEHGGHFDGQSFIQDYIVNTNAEIYAERFDEEVYLKVLPYSQEPERFQDIVRQEIKSFKRLEDFILEYMHNPREAYAVHSNQKMMLLSFDFSAVNQKYLLAFARSFPFGQQDENYWLTIKHILERHIQAAHIEYLHMDETVDDSTEHTKEA